MANIYILALFFFTICSGQVTVTSWTGAGGSNNNSFSNPINWSNGVPTETSIVYLNETTCSGCTILVDTDLTVAELHLGALTGTGGSIDIVGANLTVTGAFTLGSPSVTSYYYTYIDIQGGGILELGPDCLATIYYNSYPIRSSIPDEENWFINRGTITVLGNGGVTAGSYATLEIGYGSSYRSLIVKSWGTWIVTDGAVELEFNYLSSFHIFGGSFKGGWLTTTSSTSSPTIRWYNTDVVLQAGSDAVTFEGAVYFYNSNYQYFSGYSSTPPNSLTFNTTGITVSNALFYGTNIVFLYDGWLQDVNITYYSYVNSSSSVSGVHAYFNGDNKIVDSAVAGFGTDFYVQVESGSTLTMNSLFALFGPVTFVNNGTFIFDSGNSLYWDAASNWVNLGLLQVINHSNDYIQGSSFELSTATDVGTMINMGTIEFSHSGGLDFYSGTGDFRQCKHGILKFGYGIDGTSPGYVTFPTIQIDGYIGFYFEDDASVPTSGNSLFTFIPQDASKLPFGSFTSLFDTITNGPGLIDSSRLVCFTVAGKVAVYDLLDEKICPDGEYQALLPIAVGDACSDLSDEIKKLADIASCPAGANCGIDTGAPAGEPNPNSAHSMAVHLAFLVSLVCLLLKF